MDKLVDMLRAKSITDEGRSYLLKDHTLELLKELETLEKYLNKNETKYQVSAEEVEALVKAIFIHDLGKIYDNFQWKVFSKDEKNKKEWEQVDEFLNTTKTDYEVRHEVLSIIWSLILLQNGEWDKKIRTAVLLHHYNEFYIGEKDLMEIVISYEQEIKKYAEFIKENKEEIKEILTDLLRYFENKKLSKKYITIISEMVEGLDFQKIDSLIEKIKSHGDDISEVGGFYEIKNDSPDYDFLVFLGILRRCDYSASGDVKIESASDIKEVFKDVDSKIRKKIGTTSEIWQEKLLKQKNGRKLVLVAPTGSGKTEFAILWAKNMERKFIYTLPLRVALNDIYSRFKDKNEEKPGDEKLFDEERELSLLHSTAFIEYVKERGDGADIDTETKINTSKLFSYPVMLTTPDQVFLSSLNYYGSDKLLSIYPESAVVIDEIQTYKPEMAAIIIRTLQIIDELKGDILIITATLPPYFKEFFNKLNFDVVDISKEGITDVKNLSIKRHRLSTMPTSLFDPKKLENKEFSMVQEAKEKIEDILDTEGSKLIIVNTVSKAISLYESLKGNENENFYLLHSRLIEKEKSRRIQDMKKKMEQKKDVVLVATQVVEASVDLDFDILITEVSTVDSQVQRWGRVYRGREEDYKKSAPNIIIFTGSDRYTNYIYDKNVVEKTVKVLEENNNRLLKYKDERDLIEQVYNEKLDDGKTLEEEYKENIEKTIDELKYFTVEKKSQAQKLFREIAGYSIVVPQIMQKEGDELKKKFAEIIMLSKEEQLSWKKIISQIEEAGITINDKGNENEKKYELKKILYEYSFTMPAYYFEKYRWLVVNHEFKGFYVANFKEDQSEDVKKYGFDKVKDDIDKEMLNIY